MNESEHMLHYPLGETVAPTGGALTITPGVKWIRMALPFALDHINLWLLRDAIDAANGERIQGWSIVDCGIHTPQSQAQWENIFANELEGLPVLRVLVTHMHPDHIGLAHWLCQRWNATLWMSATDFLVARLACMGPGALEGTKGAAFFATHGLTDRKVLDKITARTGYFQAMVPSVPTQYHRLMDAKVLRLGDLEWRCISGYGHAPEHMALYCDSLRVLIGGDMLLPRISTNISVYDQEPESNPLALFLDSIDKFLVLPKDTLVLPAHGKPFTGLHTRIQQLHAHHQERLGEVLAACAGAPCSAADILPVLFKAPLDMHQTTFAIGEALAHLHALWFQGKLQRTLSPDGIYRFAAVAFLG